MNSVKLESCGTCLGILLLSEPDGELLAFKASKRHIHVCLVNINARHQPLFNLVELGQESLLQMANAVKVVNFSNLIDEFQLFFDVELVCLLGRGIRSHCHLLTSERIKKVAFQSGRFRRLAFLLHESRRRDNLLNLTFVFEVAGFVFLVSTTRSHRLYYGVCSFKLWRLIEIL